MTLTSPSIFLVPNIALFTEIKADILKLEAETDGLLGRFLNNGSLSII